MKLIICDMSGIVSIKGINNDKLLDVFPKLKSFKYSFCTGKGYLGGYETIKKYPMDLPFICENGSVIVSKDGKVLYNDCMEYSKVEKLIHNLEKIPFEFLAYVDLATHKYKFLRGSKKLTEDLSQPWFHSEEIYYDVDSFLDSIDKNNICRITTRGLELSNNVEGIEIFHVVVSENEFHSICNKGTNKGFGVKKLAELYNVVPEDVVIIGNDMNDIDMFKLDCGLKIATGNNETPKELLELADLYVNLEDLPEFLAELDKNPQNMVKCRAIRGDFL